MSNPFMEPTTFQTDCTNRMCSQTRGRLVVPDFSPTPGTMKNSVHINKTLSWNQEDRFVLLKRMQDEGIKPAMAEQITTLENIFTLIMEILLTQRMVSIANTQTA